MESGLGTTSDRKEKGGNTVPDRQTLREPCWVAIWGIGGVLGCLFEARGDAGGAAEGSCDLQAKIRDRDVLHAENKRVTKGKRFKARALGAIELWMSCFVWLRTGSGRDLAAAAA